MRWNGRWIDNDFEKIYNYIYTCIRPSEWRTHLSFYGYQSRTNRLNIPTMYRIEDMLGIATIFWCCPSNRPRVSKDIAEIHFPSKAISQLMRQLHPTDSNWIAIPSRGVEEDNEGNHGNRGNHRDHPSDLCQLPHCGPICGSYHHYCLLNPL